MCFFTIQKGLLSSGPKAFSRFDICIKMHGFSSVMSSAISMMMGEREGSTGKLLVECGANKAPGPLYLFKFN